MKFTDQYQEIISLRDGTRVLLRRLRSSDRKEIFKGFERLSGHSRYLRFLSFKEELTDRDLSFLDSINDPNHFGIVALLENCGSEEDRGVAVARFVRSREDGSIAEPAVTVSDEIQGRGLGGSLSRRLAEAARERGVTMFRCYLLAENRRVLNMLHSVFPEVKLRIAGQLLVADLRLVDSDRS